MSFKGIRNRVRSRFRKCVKNIVRRFWNFNREYRRKKELKGSRLWDCRGNLNNIIVVKIILIVVGRIAVITIVVIRRIVGFIRIIRVI